MAQGNCCVKGAEDGSVNGVPWIEEPEGRRRDEQSNSDEDSEENEDLGAAQKKRKGKEKAKK